jgi:hypothetical protein
VTLVSVLAIVTTSCGGGGGRKATTASTRSPTTEDANAKVLADFNAYTDVYARALADPNLTTQTVAEHITGEALDTFTNSRIQLLTSGRVIKSEAIHHPKVTAVQGTTATVDDCVTNDQTHYYAIGGGPHLGDTGDATILTETTMQLEAGTWKVSKVTKKASACPG